MTYQTTVAADSPQHWFKLDEASGATSFTQSGSNGTTTSMLKGSGVTAGVSGNGGTNGATFDGGANGYAGDTSGTSPASGFPRTSTIEFLIKTTDTGTVVRYGNVGNSQGWSISISATGKVNFQWGSGVNLTGATTVNTGTWKHIVVMLDNNASTASIYVNNVLDASGSGLSIVNLVNQVFLLGDNSTAGCAMTLDEFASYTTNLTTTRIAAHYNASDAGSIPGGYTAQAMTASATSVDPIVTILNPDVTYNVSPATASASAVDPVVSVVSNIDYAVSPSTASATMTDAPASTLSAVATQEWALTDSSAATTNSNTSTGTVTSMTVDDTPVKTIYIQFTNLNLPAGAVIASANLFAYDLSVAGGATIAVKKVTSAFDVTTVTHNTIPTVSGTSIYSGSASTGANNWDVTSAIQEIQAGTAYGLAILGTAFTNQFASPDNATPNQRPVLSITYRVVSSDGGYTSGPATVSAEMVDAVFSADVSSAAYPMTASADAEDVIVTIPDKTVFVDPALADASMPGGFYTHDTEVNALVLEADAMMTDATVDNTTGVIYSVGVMPALATMAPALGPDGEAEENDAYFNRLAAQLGTEDGTQYGSMWLRLDETSGTTVINRIGPDGVYFGSPTFGEFGPQSRRVVTFDGVDDYIKMAENDATTTRIRYEMVFKTEKATQVIARGLDFSTVYVANSPGTGIEMIDGKIRVIPTTGPAFTGRTRLDDGEYHHVSMTVNQSVVSIYIDGKLELRRFDSFSIFGIPDSIGGGPNYAEGIAQDFDPALFFEGSIMEFVVDLGNPISEREIVHNYYAAFGIVPIEVGAMTAAATMTTGSKGKGNQPRAIGLFYNTTTDANLDVPNYNDVYNWSGLRTSPNLFGMLHLNDAVPSASFDMGGYKVFPKSIILDEYNVGDYTFDYYDQVTGEQEFINLAEDMDLSDVDLVFFINLPPRVVSVNPNTFEETIAYNGRYDAMFERLMTGLRTAQDEHGFSIWAPQPEVALGLGIISDFDVHSMLRGAPGGPMTPFGKPGTGDYDTRALNRHRVVSTVDGLTSFGGYILKDYIFGFGPSNGGNYQPPNEAWDYVERPSGLLIGDEFFYSQDFYQALGSASWFSGGGYNQRRTVISVPSDAVQAGLIVTKENATHYLGDTIVPNPWSDNATSIVVSPGDTLNGTPVGGKIYVNFMDSIDGTNPTFKKQLVPPNELIPVVGDRETTEMREWEYSSTRVARVAQTVSGTTLNPGVPTAPAPDAGAEAWANYQYLLTLSSLNTSGNIIVVNESEKYPTTYLENYSMINRAFRWLQDIPEVGDGDETVRTTAAVATAEMANAIGVGEQEVVINATAALANADIVEPDEVVNPDAGYSVLPMLAFANMTGYGKIIEVDAMTAEAEMVEDFAVVHASGEQVVLYLHYTDATVYLKEDI